MSKKNWLEKLIFVDDNNDSEEENTKQPDSVARPIKDTYTSAKPIPTPISTTNDLLTNEVLDPSLIIGQIDPVFLNKLCEILDSQTSEGIDYLKFKKSADSLRDLQPDETMRLTTAFLTLKATYPSMTKENLSQTIVHYIDLMEQERKKGLDELNNLRKQNIEKKATEIDKALKDIEKMKAEIQSLSKYVTETNLQIVEKKNEYAKQEADFNATIDKIVNQLNGDKTKIETIIKTN